jgi:hypothetical protein
MIENQKNCDSKFLSEVPGVDFWSRQCLPFPKQGEPMDITLERDKLRQNIKKMPVPEESKILHATLQTPYNDDPFDLENKLIYNVGTGAFKQASRHGICIERLRRNTESIRQYQHKYRYAPPTEQPTEKNFLTFAFELKRLNGNVKPITIWAASVTALMGLGKHPSTEISKDGRFELWIELITSTRWSGNLAALMKPLLDGIISALHYPSEVIDEDVISLMKKASSENAAQLEDLLIAGNHQILGPRKLVQRWGKSSFRWNPADDRCDWCRILIKRNGSAMQNGFIHCKVSVRPRTIETT